MQLSSSLPLLSLLLALHATATPTLFRRDVRSPDACGPTRQNPISPKDTCSTAPALSANAGKGAPSTFTTTCIANPGLGKYGYNIFTGCMSLVDQVCNSLSVAVAPRDRWVWVESQACAMGFWMPGISTSALVPTLPQCQSIFKTMTTQCASPILKAQGAGVNLQILPKGQYIQTGTGPGQGSSGTGMAVEPLYPSYMMFSKLTQS